MSAATLKTIRLECYLPRLSGANKVSLFRADSLARYFAAVHTGFECRCNGQNGCRFNLLEPEFYI
jgi:hypothetical protein